ncbi:hypothetical protein HDK64DRAFT_268540 [Phyllosticta capitalensis]|uniref:Myb-like domain-containing protein n=2 Tax=Phyllosticta capitalensis TaxID=121624 RepID=A0ABR1YPT1_9PEZI
MNNHKMMFTPPSRYALAPSKEDQAAQYRCHPVPFPNGFSFETEPSMASPEWSQFPQLEQCCSSIPQSYDHSGHAEFSQVHQRESTDLYKSEVPACPYDNWGLTSSRAITMQGPSAEWQTPSAYFENGVKDRDDWQRQRVTSVSNPSLGFADGMDGPRLQTPLYSVPTTQDVDHSSSTLLSAPLTGAETSPAFRSSHKSEDSPLAEPRALHGSAWEWFHPTNQCDGILPQTDHAVAQDVAPSPASTAPSGSIPRKNPLLENHYYGLPVWNGLELGFSSSESESKASPGPSFYPSHVHWMGENSSFGSDVPALTYSQASPASDWEDVPAETQCQTDVVEGSQATGYCLRNLRQRRIVSPSDEEEAWKNEFLVEKKRAGWTYKMIKQQGGFTEAESTLRGRYRALTKQRKDRVRKPTWQRRDIQLLREAVAKHFVGRFVSNADVASSSWANVPDAYIDPNKILWKDVADYIRDNGGSYHFGNATCKKMWLKIHGRS